MATAGDTPKVLSKKEYEKELARPQEELVRLQEWVVYAGLKIAILFEGRDTAGKGGVIKRAGSGRDGPLRSQLVQPGRRRVVMGFCTEAEYQEFMRSTPSFERILMRSGLILIKYWLSISDDEQERRFKARIEDPTKRWKLSPMDLEARARWVDYAEAKDEMEKIELPPRQERAYARPPVDTQTFVPTRYVVE